MDPKERISDLREMLLATLTGWQADMWTSMPGIIQSVNFAEQTCVVQVAIQANVTDIKTGTASWQSISPLLDCPLFFPHGGGMSITFPVAAGDECLVCFASRCIDGWFGTGAVQPQGLFRMHDLSDGFAFAGFRSQPKVISGISSTKLQIRDAANTNLIEIDPTAGTIALTSVAKVTITAPEIDLDGIVNVTGLLTAEAGATVVGLTATDTLSVGGHPYTAHIHTGGTLSGGHTGPPV